LSLATFSDLRDNASMPPDLMALFLLAGALSAVTIATLMYADFPRPEPRFTLVVTLLLVYAVLTLAPVVVLSPHVLP
jgi:RsiW-degrading membrane proteinase PrsW (M82 family)